MLLYMVHILHVFIPVSLMAGMFVALWKRNEERKAFRPLIVCLAAGLLSGMIVYHIASQQDALTSARVVFHAVGILAVAINAVILILPANRYRILAGIGWGAALFLTTILFAIAGFSFLALSSEQALSAIGILNTELLLNIVGILAGSSIVAFLIPLTSRLSGKTGRGLVLGVFLFVSAVLAAQWFADVLLGLMRLEMVEVTSGRLSFVAKTNQYLHLFPYVQVLIVTALSLFFFGKRTVLLTPDPPGMTKAERRKARSKGLFEMRWFKSALASAGVILAVFLYYDLYASRPPRISTPINLKPDAGGLIRVKIDDVKDGDLHRYSYVTEDGQVVRFFMMNRAKGQNRIAVVYDACMLCGDMGYLKEKNEVICIACNVRIFTPSIGKAGGCNPIPLKHSVEGEHIIVRAEDLEKGAQYFSR